jgi:hypothetical protein
MGETARRRFIADRSGFDNGSDGRSDRAELIRPATANPEADDDSCCARMARPHHRPGILVPGYRGPPGEIDLHLARCGPGSRCWGWGEGIANGLMKVPSLPELKTFVIYIVLVTNLHQNSGRSQKSKSYPPLLCKSDPGSMN